MAFSPFVVTNSAPHSSYKYAVPTLIHQWITKFGPPQFLVMDRYTEYGYQEQGPYLLSV